MVITDIEKAIVERLRKGMGRMAKNVRSYGGELDGEPAEVLCQLPAVCDVRRVQKPSHTAQHGNGLSLTVALSWW